ncbi:MAG: HNH endonuclease [Gemmatimonadetes bacterium]|nr:HNH endonuclease [Gemmatimonadota bacterium]
MRALILNATYEPLSIVSARRAIVLVLRQKAVVLEESGTTWRSERSSFQLPSVIRLKAYVKVPYARRVPPNRRAVFARDEHACQYCGTGAENLDHVMPRSRGGTHTWENIVAACRKCNLRKGDRTPVEADMPLRSAPQAPRRHGWVLVNLGAPPHPSWQPYLAGAF